mmetsp:Transcript_73033/g.144808  ORF Transcript_73033/g.144808 Transcript_73033/m.144808 type:complete len:228 (-) Transcript_73033:170-853(-)
MLPPLPHLPVTEGTSMNACIVQVLPTSAATAACCLSEQCSRVSSTLFTKTMGCLCSCYRRPPVPDPHCAVLPSIVPSNAIPLRHSDGEAICSCPELFEVLQHLIPVSNDCNLDKADLRVMGHSCALQGIEPSVVHREKALRAAALAPMFVQEWSALPVAKLRTPAHGLHGRKWRLHYQAVFFVLLRYVATCHPPIADNLDLLHGVIHTLSISKPWVDNILGKGNLQR